MTAPDTQLEDLYARLRADLDPDERTALEDEAHARYLELIVGLSAVTGTGLPYPVPTDPISQGADAIRALAEAIDTQIPVRQIAYAYVAPLLLLTTSPATIAGATITVPVVQGQAYVIKLICTIANSASGADRTATIRLYEAGVAVATPAFAIPYVTGSSSTTCVVLFQRTAAATGNLVYTVTSNANLANAVNFQDAEISATRKPS
jgi:hypothetical protein